MSCMYSNESYETIKLCRDGEAFLHCGTRWICCPVIFQNCALFLWCLALAQMVSRLQILQISPIIEIRSRNGALRNVYNKNMEMAKRVNRLSMRFFPERLGYATVDAFPCNMQEMRRATVLEHVCPAYIQFAQNLSEYLRYQPMRCSQTAGV